MFLPVQPKPLSGRNGKKACYYFIVTEGSEN